MFYGKWPDEVAARPLEQYREMLHAVWDRMDDEAKRWQIPSDEEVEVS